MRSPAVILLVALSLACAGSPGEQPGQASADSASSPGLGETAATATDTGPVAFGIAVSDTAGAWCAMFPPDSASPITAGRAVSIVFGDSTAPLSAVIVRPTKPCHAEVGQSRWFDYSGYDLALRSDVDATQGLPIVGLAVASNALWSRDADGMARADLTGDGRPEEVRRCAADEGHHYTVWSTGADGRRERIGHEYFDWGALVEPTCKAGESG